MLKKITILLFLALLCGFNAGQAKMRPIAKRRAGIPPFDVLQKILATNLSLQAAAKKTGITGPWITWLADADARLQPRHILPEPTDRLFAVRNLGNQLAVSLSAVDYGVRYLHTPMLLITAPDDSRAVKFYLEDQDEPPSIIRQDIDHLRPALAAREKEKLIGKQPVELLDFVEANIDFQVQEAISRYRDRLKNGRLVIVGAVFDLEDKYGRGRNKLIIININGEKEGKKLQKSRMAKKLDGKLLRFIGRKKKN